MASGLLPGYETLSEPSTGLTATCRQAFALVRPLTPDGPTTYCPADVERIAKYFRTSPSRHAVLTGVPGLQRNRRPGLSPCAVTGRVRATAGHLPPASHPRPTRRPPASHPQTIREEK
ncbi:hypothetical protein GCM10011574_70900 [Microbispora bryophytorum]|uniref:Uncharacterized protein n=1 Tax=Microbispora bryophytorum TaxID=1460882 RepID=A0A8H9H642_9ACTN|nr:hypothetical protein GCM10011574_70900 [Microbispora bryophytorum]